MAERRMFAKSIVLSDAFLDMPMSARCLYFTLGMLADDDGFVGNPKAIMRQCGASQDDVVVLLQKRYILSFDNGVIVIKHWRMNNYLQNDRHKSTTYMEELSTLKIDEKGAYTEKEKGMYTECIQNVYTGKVSIDKDSIDKESIDKDSLVKDKVKRFTPPTIDEVKDFIWQQGYSVDAEYWFNYYESNGWMVGRNKMKNWQACIAQWNAREKKSKPIGQKQSIADKWANA